MRGLWFEILTHCGETFTNDHLTFLNSYTILQIYNYPVPLCSICYLWAFDSNKMHVSTCAGSKTGWNLNHYWTIFSICTQCMHIDRCKLVWPCLLNQVISTSYGNITNIMQRQPDNKICLDTCFVYKVLMWSSFCRQKLYFY